MNKYVKYMIGLERGRQSEEIALKFFKAKLTGWGVHPTEHFDVLDLHGVDLVLFDPEKDRVELVQVKSSRAAALKRLDEYQEKGIDVVYVDRNNKIKKVGDSKPTFLSSTDFKELVEELNK